MIANREYVIKKLAELITEPQKKYSQNFLTDDSIVKQAVASLSAYSFDEVLEIGPGLGALSEEILRKGYPLTAFEIDPILCSHLEKTFSRYRFHLIPGDFCKQDLSPFKDKKIAWISNIPYNITTPVIEKILTANIDFPVFIFMVQKEVKDRLDAQINTKDYSPLTILLKYLGTFSTICKAPRDRFIPSPNVDSIILKFEVTQKRDFAFEQSFYQLLKGAFVMRRKTILNNLTSFFHSKEKALMLLNSVSISPTLRPEQISLDQFLSLGKAFYNSNQ